MEIKLESRQAQVWREVFRQTRRIQESTDCVVPDTEEDINRIAAVQTSVFLKSKDLTGTGVQISGEACSSLICIGEGQDSVSVVRVVKPFAVEFEIPDLTAETQAQTALTIQATDARVVNPRKVSVTFEIAVEVGCFTRSAAAVETVLPEAGQAGLYARTEEAELTLPNAVTEKIFAIHEQFKLAEETARPSRLISEKAELSISDCQLIGSKAVIKGTAELAVIYLAEGSACPAKASFSCPFSQIVDIGSEQMAFCTVRPELTAAYYDLTDTIGGDRALDMELHILLELVSYASLPVRYVTDAYSNLMPCEVVREREQYDTAAAVRRRRISDEERLHVMDDCARVLCVCPALIRTALEQGKLSAAVNLDILYETESGQLSSARRAVMLSDEDAGDERLLSARLSEIQLSADGQFVEVRLTMEAVTVAAAQTELNRVTRVVLDEEKPFDVSAFPTVTMVRAGGQSLWELAKQYHSSEEQIRLMNEEAEDLSGKMLLIARVI